MKDNILLRLKILIKKSILWSMLFCSGILIVTTIAFNDQSMIYVRIGVFLFSCVYLVASSLELNFFNLKDKIPLICSKEVSKHILFWCVCFFLSMILLIIPTSKQQPLDTQNINIEVDEKSEVEENEKTNEVKTKDKASINNSKEKSDNDEQISKENNTPNSNVQNTISYDYPEPEEVTIKGAPEYVKGALDVKKLLKKVAKEENVYLNYIENEIDGSLYMEISCVNDVNYVKNLTEDIAKKMSNLGFENVLWITYTDISKSEDSPNRVITHADIYPDGTIDFYK